MVAWSSVAPILRPCLLDMNALKRLGRQQKAGLDLYASVSSELSIPGSSIIYKAIHRLCRTYDRSLKPLTPRIKPSGRLIGFTPDSMSLSMRSMTPPVTPLWDVLPEKCLLWECDKAEFAHTVL